MLTNLNKIKNCGHLPLTPTNVGIHYFRQILCVLILNHIVEDKDRSTSSILLKGFLKNGCILYWPDVSKTFSYGNTSYFVFGFVSSKVMKQFLVILEKLFAF